MSHLKTQLLIPGSQMSVFKYATSPENFPMQLSDNIEVEWLNPGTELRVGAEFSFLMKRMRLEQPVRFRVDKLTVGSTLMYQQLEGLLHMWMHTMKFEEAGPNETLITDLVEYSMPLGLAGRLVDDIWWRKDLTKILEQRLYKIQKHFSGLNEESSA